MPLPACSQENLARRKFASMRSIPAWSRPKACKARASSVLISRRGRTTNTPHCGRAQAFGRNQRLAAYGRSFRQLIDSLAKARLPLGWVAAVQRFRSLLETVVPFWVEFLEVIVHLLVEIRELRHPAVELEEIQHGDV